MATVLYQNSTRLGDRVEVIAKVDDRQHLIVVPISALAARAEKEGITEDEALQAFLNEPFVEHTITPPTKAFMNELKGHTDAALEVHQSNLSTRNGTGNSSPSTERGEQRRHGFLAGMDDDPGPVRSGNRRRVVARKQARHG